MSDTPTRQEKYARILAEVLQGLRNDAANPEPPVYIEEETDSLLETLDEGQDRTVIYHKTCPTPEDLEAILFVAPDVNPHAIELLGGIQTLCRILSETDPVMLMTLRHIIIATESDDDLTAIAKHTDCEEWEVAAYFDFLGMFWYSESAVILNMTTLGETVTAMAKEMKLDDREQNEEFVIGCYSTLIHELRHLGLDNPYLPESDYPPSLACEQAVEQYCRRETDSLLATLRRIAGEYRPKLTETERSWFTRPSTT